MPEVSQHATAAEWLTAWSTLALVLATAGLAAVALFQEQLRSLIWRPRLDASIQTSPPDCVAVPFNQYGPTGLIASASSYYFRVRIENRGNRSAQRVEVFGAELRQRTPSGTWVVVPTFLPMNFVWSNTGPTRTILYPQIMPGTFRHVDIGHIIDPAQRKAFNEDSPALALSTSEVSLAFDQVVQTSNYAHVIPPGDYELDLLIAAENAPTVKKVLTLIIRGPWSPVPMTMLNTHVDLKVT
jgi:hypothetical protein